MAAWEERVGCLGGGRSQKIGLGSLRERDRGPKAACLGDEGNHGSLSGDWKIQEREG